MQRNLLKLRGTCWHDPQASKTQHARLVTPLSTIDVVIDAYNPRDATKKGPSLHQVMHVLCLGFWTSEISEFGQFGQFGLMLIILECFGIFWNVLECLPSWGVIKCSSGTSIPRSVTTEPGQGSQLVMSHL